MARCCGNDVQIEQGPPGPTGPQGPPGPPGPSGDGDITVIWDDVLDKPSSFPSTWSNVSGKPVTYPPSSHEHSANDITSGVLPMERGGTGQGSVTANRFLTTTADGYAQSTAADSRTLIGLGNVNNTSDANKPVSSAQQAALNLKANTADLAAVATSGNAADLTGVLSTAQLPPLAIGDTFEVANQAAMLALTAQRGDMAIRADQNGKFFMLIAEPASTLANWKPIVAAGDVSSVAGKIGAVTLTKGDVGLGNVDNTADIDKPVSTATTTALAGKANTSHVHSAADITSGTLVVARGGTGRASHTAYALIAGGTGTTTAQQSIGNGTAGHILKSNGSSAVPSFSAGTPSDVGLSNVNNTSDADKPVSTAQATALAGKAPTVHTHTASQISDATTIGRNALTASSLTLAQQAIGIVYDSTGTLDPSGLPDGTIIIRYTP